MTSALYLIHSVRSGALRTECRIGDEKAAVEAGRNLRQGRGRQQGCKEAEEAAGGGIKISVTIAKSRKLFFEKMSYAYLSPNRKSGLSK